MKTLSPEMISLSQICHDLKLQPKQARTKLRRKGFKMSHWLFERNSTVYHRVLEILKNEKHV